MIQYVKSPSESSDVDGYFEAVVDFCGQPTKVSFDANDATLIDLEPPLAYLLANTEIVMAIASSAVETELLPLYNNNWRCYSTGTGEEVERPELSLSDFLATIALDEIEISETWIELWYDDGDLFFGHAVKIAIRHSAENGVVSLGAATTGLEG